MKTTRYFSGSRVDSRMGDAAKLKRLEIMKGGKLPFTSADRYKRILAKKLAEHQKKASVFNAYSAFSLPGTKSTAAHMSKSARRALEEISKRNALKEEKAMRQMVVIKPREYGGFGRIDAKGRVFDQANNIALRVDAKTGMLKTPGGFSVGKYRPKSWLHESFMREQIVKHSPYHIRLRMAMLQQQVALMYAGQYDNLAHPVTVHGIPAEMASMLASNVYGNAQDISSGETFVSNRNNLGVTSHGVVSNNVWGTFGENVHGTFGDNVWGRASTDIWGGIDAGGMWRSNGPARRIWGSAQGKNYIARGFWALAGLFGFAGNVRRAAARTQARRRG